YSADYDDEDQPIPFRKRVFSSCLDGKHITGKNVEDLIKSKSFKKLDDEDAVSLCYIGIVQLVLLGLKDRRVVPNWILRDANVKRWLPLYATESTNEDDNKSYSIMRFTWAFKGRVPLERLIPDELEAGSELILIFCPKVEMSRDVLTVGSTMRIPLLYRGEYSQWVERFMNYLEEQTDGEAMINSIKNGDQPLPHVTQVSIAGTTSTEQPPLKDKSMWSDQEKRVQKIDRLARPLLIQGLLIAGFSPLFNLQIDQTMCEHIV
nr:hypothetical protein [Tanacetum cinerariifolium]